MKMFERAYSFIEDASETAGIFMCGFTVGYLLADVVLVMTR